VKLFLLGIIASGFPSSPVETNYLLKSYFDELDQDDSGILLSGTTGKLVLSSSV
jgi:hypothetical protein